MRLLLKMQLVMFHFNGIGMRSILVMISQGRRLKRRKVERNSNPFLLELMIPKIGGFYIGLMVHRLIDVWSVGVIAYILLCSSRPFWPLTEFGIVLGNLHSRS